MDTPTLIVGSVLVALCFGPFLFFIFKGRKGQKDRVTLFDKLAVQHNLLITQSDAFGSKVIGIDEKKMILFLTEVKDNKDSFQLIDINRLISCRPKEVHSHSAEMKQSYLTWVGLDMIFPKDDHRAIAFFDFQEDLELTEEQHFARKWSMIINAALRDTQVRRKKDVGTKGQADPVAVSA